MEYRFLGNTGLKVSVISFGNCLNSEHPDWQEKTNHAIKKAWDFGINYFDTAEFYGYGEAERQLGIAIKTLNVPREDLVISTKIYYGAPGTQMKINQVGLNRKHIKEGLNNSLKRLQLDYVDIVFCHRFDEDTPLEEVARTFTELIKEGKVHYWGTSEWSAANIFEVREICAEHNLIKPVVEQPQYSILERDNIEAGYRRLLDNYKLGTTVWSPLAGGILTGKYNNGEIPDGARWSTFSENPLLAKMWNLYFSPEKKEKFLSILAGLKQIADELGISQSQLAMSWVIANKDVSTAITGCSRIEQLEEIVKCVQLYKKITPEIVRRIDDLVGNSPDQGTNFKTFSPFPSRRR